MAGPGITSSLSKHLFELPETTELYKRATQCEFLKQAGSGVLPRGTLSVWLAQDRLYQQAYVRFVGGLISRVILPKAVLKGESTNSILEWRILAMLQSALGAIITELHFYEGVAKTYGLDLQAKDPGMTGVEFGANKVTTEYIELFDSFATKKPNVGQTSHPKSLLEGLVLLWVTERVYYDAWTFANHESKGGKSDPKQDADGGALRNEFIPNWTSQQFREFVDEIAMCVDLYVKDQSKQDHQADEEAVEIARSVWKKVLKLEEGFWPTV